ncbi:hypothetical protein ACLMJK_007235 [Lecanora helva]
MAPTALQSTSELTDSAIKHAATKTAALTSTNSSVEHINELDSSRLVFTRNQNPKDVPEPDSPEVRAINVGTDHMITCQWTSKTGWQAPHLQPYGPLQLMPTASCLHYATECFEGLKFYRGHDLRLRLFRPNRNAHRMLQSAARISLPTFDPNELQKLIETLVAVDGEKWLPKTRPGTFLYLRPTMIANGTSLGVQKPQEALLYIIAVCFPTVGARKETAEINAGIPSSQKKSDSPGFKLLAGKEDTVRAWPGGWGYAKVGANYGPSLMAQTEARARGYDQVLWLLGSECEVTEVGASNFFVVWRTREGVMQLITAPLGDKIILDGVTRASVLELARERLVGEVEVVERRFTMFEVEEAYEEGRLVEAFAAGTAVFVTPVSRIHFRDRDIDIPTLEGATGRFAGMLQRWLEGIMYGNEQHEWGVVVQERQFDR